MIYNYDPLFDDEADEFWLPESEQTNGTMADALATYQIAGGILGAVMRFVFGLMGGVIRLARWYMRL